MAAKVVADTEAEGSQEAEVLGRLQECSGVVRLVEVVHSGLQTLLVMEHLAGGCVLGLLTLVCRRQPV